VKLYDLRNAPNPRRVKIFLAEKKISLPIEALDIETKEHLTPGVLAKNPLGKLPVLELDDGVRGVSRRVLDRSVRAEPLGVAPTRAGLVVRCQLDRNSYPAGIKVSDAQMRAINLARHDFHGEWNYTVSPTHTLAQ